MLTVVSLEIVQKGSTQDCHNSELLGNCHNRDSLDTVTTSVAPIIVQKGHNQNPLVTVSPT